MTRTYDLVMTHKLDTDDLFIHRVQWHCAGAGLNFFLLEPLWVEPFHIYLSLGAIHARVLLNMHSEHHQPTDIYHRVVKLAADKGTKVIDPPDVAMAAFDKGNLHPQLVAAGINVPHTVIVEGDRAASFHLTEGDRAALGTPFVIKPSLGYGRHGVVLDAKNEGDLARSVAAWPYGSYLLQQRIVPRALRDWPAYFRVFFVFGSVWLCWWNCYTDAFRLVSAPERADFKLDPLEDIVRRIAALTKMRFFSSEIARTDAGEFVVIDYVNDQCHMLSQSANPKIGVPDELVAAIAQRVVEATREMIAKK